MAEVLIGSKRGGMSPEGYRRIDVTSHARDVFRSCSPFLCGPVSLYDGYVSKTVENGWQFSKVYRPHVDADGNPSSAYFEWAKEGWDSGIAQRYPMGRIPPLYAWWKGQKLGYIESRKQIYIPLYTQAVVRTDGFKELKRLYDAGESLCLLDFDSYDFKALGYSAEDIINDPDHKLGHGFVLKFLLEGSVPMPHPFRLIVAGGRDFADYEMLAKALDDALRVRKLNEVEIVSGMARGADALGVRYAKERGYPVKEFPAEWDKLGKRAGYIRNEAMAVYADALFAFWDGKSKGTAHMIKTAQDLGLQVRVKRYEETRPL